MTDPATPTGPREVFMRTPSGEIHPFRPEDVDQAISAGASIVSEGDAQLEAARAKYGTGIGDTLTGAVVEGLSVPTLGLSDRLGANIGGQGFRDYRKGWQLAHPVAKPIADVAGFVVPEVLSLGSYTPLGLAGSAARGAEGLAGRALGEGFLSKAVGMGLGGALEGGAMGAGDAISEAALGDEQLNAEKLLAGAGQGALAGGGLGFGLGLAGGAVSHGAGALVRGVKSLGRGALEGVEGKAASDIASELSGKYAFKATGAGASDFKQMALKGRDVSETGNFLQEQYLAKTGKAMLPNREELYEFTKALKTEMGESVGAATRAIDAEVKAAAKAELQPIAATSNFIQRAESDVLGKLADSPVYQEEAAKIRALIDKFKAKAGLDVAPEALSQLRVEAAGGNVEAAAKVADVEARQSAVTYEKLHQWRHELDTKINWKNPEIKPLNEAHKAMRQIAEQEIEKAAAGVGGTTGQAYNQAKLDYIKSSDLEKAASGGYGRLAAARTFGLSEQMGLIQGMLSSGSTIGGAAASALQYAVRNYGDQAAAALLRKASTLDNMKRAIIRTDALKGSAIDAFFSKQTASIGARTGSVAGITRKIEAVKKDAATPPQYRSDPHAPDPLIAPKTNFAYQQVRTNAVNWLASQIPQGAPRTPLIPTIKLPPSKTQLLAWEAKADVFENPIGTIGHAMKTGTLRAEHVDALDAMYPKLAEDLRRSFQAALVGVTSQKDLPSGNKLRQLGILLRVPATPDQDPQFIASQQAVYQQAAQENQAANAGRPKPGGSGKPSNLSTGEDELE